MKRRSVKGAWCASVFYIWHTEIADAYGLTPHYEDDGEHRTIMLLGPDSPAEMTLRFHRGYLRDRWLQSFGGLIAQWMDQRGRWFTGRTEPVVPADWRM